MRAVWKGHIRFSLMTIPVAIYNATDTSKSISFNQVHKDCNGHVGHKQVCKKCNQEVESKDIQKGYAYDKENFVIINEEDIAKVRIPSTKVIELAGFVNMHEVDYRMFEKPYYVAPDGKVAVDAYNLFVEALKKSKKVGMGKVCIRNREEPVLMYVVGDVLTFYVLRHKNEIKNVKEVPIMQSENSPKPAEVDMAQMLINSMTVPFASMTFEDKYQEGLREVVRAKMEGKEVSVEASSTVAPPVDIMAVLRQSIQIQQQAAKTESDSASVVAAEEEPKKKGRAAKTK